MKVFSSKNFIYFGFTFLFVIGLYFSKDFGISWDEHGHRKRGKQNIAYISRVLGLENFLPVPQHVKNPDIRVIGYGPMFEILCLASEKLFLIEDGKKIYQFRHKINFTIYFISAFILYLFLKLFFNSQVFGLIGAMFYLLNPRILAHGFFNPKDSISQAIIACAILPLFLTYRKKSISMSLISGLLVGIAITIRLPIIYIPFLFILLIIFRNFNDWSTFRIEFKNVKIIIYFLTATIISIFLCFPELWDAPIKKFQIIFGKLSHYQWAGNNLYLGKLIPAFNAPWHYIPVWIVVTTPITFLMALIVGILKSSVDVINRKGKDYLFQTFMLAGFIVPIVIIAFIKSTLYNGWRHVFFIYPFIVFFMAYGFQIIYQWLSLKFTRNNTKILCGLIIITFSNPLFFIFSAHPNQHVYFNKFAGPDPLENFEGDYWAASMRQAVDWIAENDARNNINVLSPLNVAWKNNVMLNKNYRDKLNYLPIKPISLNSEIRKNDKNLSGDKIIKSPVSYFITNSRLEKEGFTLKSKNEVFSVNSGNLKLWTVYKDD